MDYVMVSAIVGCAAWLWGKSWRKDPPSDLVVNTLLYEAQAALAREADTQKALQMSMLILERVIAILPEDHQRDIQGELRRLKDALSVLDRPASSAPQLSRGRKHLKVVGH